MNSIYPVIGTLILLFLGYRFYSRYLAVNVFQLDDSRPTPAVTMEDGVDYVPTPKPVVLNHHFASIAGLSPILGPALAVIWGWLPAVIWLVVGAILMGAVHDFSSLVISIRNKGRSIGDICNNLLGNRARILFLLIIFFGLALAMGTFTKVIAALMQANAEGFTSYPEAAFPAGMLMVIAVICGVLMRKGIMSLTVAGTIGTVLLFICIYLGTKIPIPLSSGSWIYILLVYAFIASVLPVWLLLQPRDFINAFALYIGMFLLYTVVFVFQPTIVAPAINTESTGMPNMFPFLFVVIACGAVSGFHCVVSSGTTAKQLAKESDARAVGYGSMLAECALGVIAVIACTAGFSSQQEWMSHYATWGQAQGLGAKLSVFVQGGANFITNLGISKGIAEAFVALVVVSFALTTLDSGTRLLRYNIEEIANTFHIPVLGNRYMATAVGIGAIWFLAVSPLGAQLWVLFGTTNQLLAGLALLTATVYLVTNKRPALATAIPMCIMLTITLVALVLNLVNYYQQGNTTLIVVGSLLLLLAIGLIVELIIFLTTRGSGQTPVTESESPTELSTN